MSDYNIIMEYINKNLSKDWTKSIEIADIEFIDIKLNEYDKTYLDYIETNIKNEFAKLEYYKTILIPSSIAVFAMFITFNVAISGKDILFIIFNLISIPAFSVALLLYTIDIFKVKYKICFLNLILDRINKIK
ncbi:hypothetical protein BN175_2830004 [Clostridioides difficile T23]|uniref:hypothetical protein n=2 Tax=Clostridioides difficile TaxID=1496 RepID=UPI0003B2A7D8|nr:hypothetical protein [Clostridioides difficile]CCL36149.1 hypothetical protein BN175_2830004 [Clostridioides difficile T23]EGT5445839.1 hypothetical protein [Clostridioides difficile]EIJ0739155.1 hypothetical protein [Clostridioides difficile]MBH7672105.1 hypothetical protein [Clostridioides difficile]MBY1581180.1 hypothetical protein [Clostridioides difficile]